MSASKAGSLQDGLVSVGFSNRVTPEDTLVPLSRLMHSKGMYHRSGSGALSLAYVGAGRLIGYFEPHMNTWDFAASVLIIREAGGKTNDCLPNEETLIKGGLVLAAAPGVYDELSDGILLTEKCVFGKMFGDSGFDQFLRFDIGLARHVLYAFALDVQGFKTLEVIQCECTGCPDNYAGEFVPFLNRRHC